MQAHTVCVKILADVEETCVLKIYFRHFNCSHCHNLVVACNIKTIHHFTKFYYYHGLHYIIMVLHDLINAGYVKNAQGLLALVVIGQRCHENFSTYILHCNSI